MTLYDCGDDKACQCLEAGPNATRDQKNALLDAKIASARLFHEKEKAAGRTKMSDGRESTLLDLLLPDERARLFELAGTTKVTDDLTTDASDPLARAQREHAERYRPALVHTERSRAFVEGWDPDDHHAALERKYGGLR